MYRKQVEIMYCSCVILCVLALPSICGAEEFIIGWYSGNENFDTYISDMVANGADTVMAYSVHWPDDAKAREVLNYAQNLGAKVYLELPYGEVAAGDTAFVTKYVNKFKDYSALRMWRMHDEPIASYEPDKDPNKMELSYQAVKAADPNHLVTCTFAEPEMEAYINTVDFVDLDVYPCTYTNPAPSTMLYYVPQRLKRVSEISAAAGKGLPLFTCQSFQDDGTTPFDFRLPTFDETRYMVFSSVTIGVRGIMFWLYPENMPGYAAGTGPRCTQTHREQVVFPVIQQLHSIKQALESPLGDGGITVTSNKDVDTTGHNVNDVTYALYKNVLDGYEDYYLVVANNLSSSLSNVTLTLDLPAFTYDVEVLHEMSQVFTFVQNGGNYDLTDDIDGWGVHIYKIRGDLIISGTCGDQGHPYPEGDINEDCKVNLIDFGIMAGDWLGCNDPLDPACN